MKLLLREIRLICFFTLTRLMLCVIGLSLNSNMVPFHKNRVFNMKILRNKCIQYISDKLICRNNIIRRCNISITNKLTTKSLTSTTSNYISALRVYRVTFYYAKSTCFLTTTRHLLLQMKKHYLI